MPMRSGSCLISVALVMAGLVCSFANVSAAQQAAFSEGLSPFSGLSGSALTISKHVDEVNLAFSVVDKKGHFIKYWTTTIRPRQ
jgi:hypothetical protein